MAAQGEVADLGGRRGPPGVEPPRPDLLVKLGGKAARGLRLQLPVDPDLDPRRLRDEEDARRHPHQGRFHRLGVPRGDADRADVLLVALAEHLQGVLPGQHLDREEVGEAEVLAHVARADQGDLCPGRLRGDREVADERSLHAVEQLDHLRRDPLLRERVVGLELHELPEVLGGLLREPDAEVHASPVLVGLGQHVAAARRQRRRPHRLQAGDDLVERHEGTALVGSVELGDRARQRVLRGLLLALHRFLLIRRGLGGGARGAEEKPGRHEGEPEPTDPRHSCLSWRTHGVAPASDSAAPAPPDRRRRGRRRWRPR